MGQKELTSPPTIVFMIFGGVFGLLVAIGVSKTMEMLK